MTKGEQMYDDELLYTWEKMEDIEAEYNHKESRISEESREIVEYINSLPEFERKVFYLYTEYQSYRKVSYETNRGKDFIMGIIRKIRKDVESKKYIIK